jgi:hypothetical protein
VLTPGHSATFTIHSLYGDEQSTSVTWTMSSRVVAKTHGSFGAAENPGYEDLGFQMTIRNNGPAPTAGSPDYGSSLIWMGTDGRSDDTLASTGPSPGPEDLGLTGTEITLQSSLQPGGYVSGYLIWVVPVAPGYLTLMSGSGDLSTQPVLRIDLATPPPSAPASAQASAAPTSAAPASAPTQSYQSDPTAGSGTGSACTTVAGYFPGGLPGHEDPTGFCVPDHM